MSDQTILSPLPESEWAAELEPIAAQLKPVLNIHRIIANNPALMAAYTPLRQYVVRGSSLTERQREIVILRVAVLVDSDYEWQHHVVRGRAAGLADSEFNAIRRGVIPAEWNKVDGCLLRGVDEMYTSQQLTETTARTLKHYIGAGGLLDLIFTVGVYLTMGTILNTFDVPLDSSVDPQPD